MNPFYKKTQQQAGQIAVIGSLFLATAASLCAPSAQAEEPAPPDQAQIMTFDPPKALSHAACSFHQTNPAFGVDHVVVAIDRAEIQIPIKGHPGNDTFAIMLNPGEGFFDYRVKTGFVFVMQDISHDPAQDILTRFSREDDVAFAANHLRDFGQYRERLTELHNKCRNMQNTL